MAKNIIVSVVLLVSMFIGQIVQGADISPMNSQTSESPEEQNNTTLINTVHEHNQQLRLYQDESRKLKEEIVKLCARVTTTEQLIQHYSNQPFRYEQIIPNDMVLKLTLMVSFFFATSKMMTETSLGPVTFFPIFLEHYLTSAVTLYYVFKLAQGIGTSMPIFPPIKKYGG